MVTRVASSAYSPRYLPPARSATPSRPQSKDLRYSDRELFMDPGFGVHFACLIHIQEGLRIPAYLVDLIGGGGHYRIVFASN